MLRHLCETLLCESVLLNAIGAAATFSIMRRFLSCRDMPHVVESGGSLLLLPNEYDSVTQRVVFFVASQNSPRYFGWCGRTQALETYRVQRDEVPRR